MARSTAKLVSIQAEPKHGYKNNSSATLQAKTLRKAYRQGCMWEDDEVARLVAGIERDETSYEMALAVGRSYYGVIAARAHIAFALRHTDAIWAE